MNINASNQSLINTLLQQASKSQEKKRPTFEQVFAKLNARTARMDANKNPINNILTNEQLFRYYIKETEPKLQISNDTFSGEELFNPMKESDPMKTYGSATTLINDIAQLSNPANNLPVEGIAPPEVPRSPTVPYAPRIPTISPSTLDQQDIQEAEMFIDSGNDFLEYFNNIDMASVNDDSKEFLNVIFAKAIGDGDWSELGQYMFDRLNNRLDEAGVVADLFQVMTAFIAMPEGLTKYHIPRAIFKLTSPPNSYGGVDDYKAILEGSEIDLRKRFYNHRDTNGAGLREADGTYSRQSRAEGERQFDKYKLNKFDPIDAVSTFFIADNQARIDKIKTGKDYERYEGDPSWVNPRLIEVQQRRRLGDTGVMISSILDDLFNDVATQLTTNTDINSNVLDPQIVDNIAERSTFFGRLFGDKSQAPSSSDLSKATTAGATSASSTIAEAGSGGANIDDVVRRRGERGPDLLPRSRRTKAQMEEDALMGAKGGK